MVLLMAVNPFGTVLSTGDRNTLALAFFFASLQARASLDDAIVVIDDPASSLDDGRAFATVQEIRGLIGRSQHVIGRLDTFRSGACDVRLIHDEFVRAARNSTSVGWLKLLGPCTRSSNPLPALRAS